jgi:nitrogen fixation protein FixH
MKNGRLIPYIIIIAFIAFATFVGSFIIRLVNTPINLESDDYYKKEIAYQSHIDKVKRSAIYKDEFKIKLVDKNVLLIIPEDLLGYQSQVQLFRPSNNELDQHLTLRLDSKKMSIDISSLQKGIWMIKINLEKGDKSYYFEKGLDI